MMSDIPPKDDPNDFSLELTPERISNKNFHTTRRGGYDPDAVHRFLTEVATLVDQLEREAHDAKLQAQIIQAAPPIPVPVKAEVVEKPYEKLAERFAHILKTADEECEQILDEARLEASRMRHEAEKELATATERKREIVKKLQAAVAVLDVPEE